MNRAEIPEQTGPDVEQKCFLKSGGEFEVPGGVPGGPRARGPQFTPPQRFATFALRLGPFAPEFRDGAPVCSENDAFFLRNGDLNFATEHTSAAKTMPRSRDARTRAEISVSLQTGAPLRKFGFPFRSRKVSFSSGNRCNRQPVNRQPVNWQPVNHLGIPQESAGIP